MVILVSFVRVPAAPIKLIVILKLVSYAFILVLKLCTQFFKPRPVPFALKERVESELNRLKQEGVLEKTHFSE